MKTSKIRIKVNGEWHELTVPNQKTLLEVIRGDLLLTGTKRICDTGECGSCTVIMDGKAVNSCIVLAVEANGKEINTIEGLSQIGKLHPIQEEFVAKGAIQCGFCTPGMIMTAKAQPGPRDCLRRPLYRGPALSRDRCGLRRGHARGER